MKRIVIPLSLFFSLIISSCWNNQIAVDDIWARPGNKGGNSAVYFAIDNPTGNRYALISAETEIADTAEIHLSRMDDTGMMVMEQQDRVEIDPRTKVMFQPGGLHVMLINLQRDLGAGDEFQLVLNFEDADSMRINVPIKEP